MKRIIAMLLAVMMVLALCACGSKAEEPAPEAAAPAAPAAEPDAAAPEAPAAPDAAPAGAASGEPSGEASEKPEVQSYMPDQGNYSKDFEGYRQYSKDGYRADPFHPAELEAETIGEMEGATEDNYTECTNWKNIIDLGVILSYEDFLAY